MIETTLGHCHDAAPALRKLSAVEALPQKTLYRVARLVDSVGKALADYEKQRRALVEKHGTVRPSTPQEIAQGGGPETTEVPPAKREAFFAEDTELRNERVELAGYPLTHAELASVKAVTAGDVVSLGPLVVWPPDDSEHEDKTHGERRHND